MTSRKQWFSIQKGQKTVGDAFERSESARCRLKGSFQVDAGIGPKTVGAVLATAENQAGRGQLLQRSFDLSFLLRRESGDQRTVGGGEIVGV